VTDFMDDRLEMLCDRYVEIERLLAAPEVLVDPRRLTALSREHAELEPVIMAVRKRDAIRAELAETRLLLDDRDVEIRSMAEAEIQEMVRELEALNADIGTMLANENDDDDGAIYLEIRQGTGGDEACLFAGDLYRMYSRYAERKNWVLDILSMHSGEVGGFKEIVCRIEGRGAYDRFQHEAGTHRVQRIPATESQGRIHTSACTVAVLPEVADVERVDIDRKDLRFDMFRASGAGGQHVNKTDSAVRITHLPTGTVVECQEERSQHRNKARALDLLHARLVLNAREQQQENRADSRRLQVGSGDRSQRIRTYNFPQGRITDHRISLTLYKLEEILEGALDALLDPLVRAHRASLLAELSS